MISFLSTEQRASRRGQRIRLLALLIASVLLHVVAFHVAKGRIGLPSWRMQQPEVIQTELLPMPVAMPAPVIPEPIAAVPKSRPRRRAAPPLPAVADAALAAPAAEEPDADTGTVTVSADADSTAAKPAGQASSAQESKPQEPATKHYKFNTPPSAELAYDVKALQKGQTWYGSGVYRWETAGDHYTATIEVGVTVLFRITALNIKSDGKIQDGGLAPVLYSEKPWRRPLVNTHFQHDNHKISFSASEAVYPYNGSEQDRASVIWQLAGIGRGDAGQFTPGAEIDVVVAGTRDADTWRFKVIGQEEVDTPYGKLVAWHVKRAPAPGSYDRTIDIWLAPRQEWYPVKVRYTEANGDYYDLSLTKTAAVDAR
ncbi:MAG TPA: DUF3108 domain-containing protein [Noviherbaspirillum sp.]